ncbi:redoxin domain-containing protein [Planktothricoides raciborskii]|uniref:Redoxin domain-containing protein n=2 Tax=Planktothricoides raciborskii TaxID=132608 RepID=A0AAU8JHM8_9CYAN|nr:redoxin domain-containing protein [Planktothricoides raciborskii]MBD2547331.1 redoxin domain-containing protein [Planktothricoides raciborskii FACHB-1370]MBD2585197.1 redoxin domain-containing protein [Planktothricoides raciborskii FACHB-1261]
MPKNQDLNQETRFLIMRQLTKIIAAGDPAPLFVLPTIEEQEVFLAQQAGTPIVLLFYGNDDFPSCRQVAATFRDCMPEFKQLNTQVISISSNSPLAGQKFAQYYQIFFSFLRNKLMIMM